MRKWEFCKFTIFDSAFWTIDEQEELTDETGSFVKYSTMQEAGLAGWEIVQFVEDTENRLAFYLLKREIPETVEIKDGVMTLEKFQQEIADYIKGIYGG